MTSLRHHFGRVAIAALLALPLAAAERPPNVLFVVADDLNCAIGPYGDPAAITPNLDRIAARGLTFERAYCQQAVCNPSRSSFLTGLRPDTVGVDDLRKYFRDTAPGGSTLVTLPQHFKNHGWFCQNIGKIFHNMGETQDRRSWSIDEAFFKGAHADDTVFANTPFPGEKRPYKAPVTEALDVPDTAYRDGQIANLAAAMLRDHAGSGQPFFLAVGFWRPHLPFVAPKKYWDLYDPAAIPPPSPAAIPENVPPIALHESREIKGYGLTPKDRPFTGEEIRHYRHGYYASISFLDAQVGKILDALEESGLAGDTLIVFTSDHGFHIGERTLWGKTTNFELDARVPLIVASPRHEASHGKRTGALAELVDLYPTLADLGGISKDLPKRLEGVSLAPVMQDPSATVKDAAFTQHPQPFYGPPGNWKAWGYSVRTERWRYTEWRPIDGQGPLLGRELYDHENDRGETRNLVENPEHQGTVANLAARLAQQFGPEEMSHPHAAMATSLDHSVGVLLEELDRSGLSKDTLVVFTSDNGGHPEYAGNAPLRGSKWNLYEGGIRVPFLARWPGKVKPRSVFDAFVTGADLFSTFAEVGNARAGKDIDGISLVPQFTDPNRPAPPREFVWHFPYYHPESGFATAPPAIGIDNGFTSQTRPYSVIRDGEWKLIHFFENGRDEIYCLSDDRAERNDLSPNYPDRTANLRKKLDAVLREKSARFPNPNPDCITP